MKIGRYKYEFDFFSWIKKTELVELDGVNPSDDPVRPELDMIFVHQKEEKYLASNIKMISRVLRALPLQMKFLQQLKKWI